MKVYLLHAASFLLTLVSSVPIMKFSASGSYDSCPSSVATYSSLGNIAADLNDAAIANGIIPPNTTAYDTMIHPTRYLRSSDGAGDSDRKLAYCGYCYTVGCSPGLYCWVLGCYSCKRNRLPKESLECYAGVE